MSLKVSVMPSARSNGSVDLENWPRTETQAEPSVLKQQKLLNFVLFSEAAQLLTSEANAIIACIVDGYQNDENRCSQEKCDLNQLSAHLMKQNVNWNKKIGLICSVFVSSIENLFDLCVKATKQGIFSCQPEVMQRDIDHFHNRVQNTLEVNCIVLRHQTKDLVNLEKLDKLEDSQLQCRYSTMTRVCYKLLYDINKELINYHDDLLLLARRLQGVCSLLHYQRSFGNEMLQRFLQMPKPIEGQFLQHLSREERVKVRSQLQMLDALKNWPEDDFGPCPVVNDETELPSYHCKVPKIWGIMQKVKEQHVRRKVREIYQACLS